MPTYVYRFSEGTKDQKDLLGGKGANLAEMTRLGLPVPPGFTITTDACRAYLADGAVPDELAVQVTTALRGVEEELGRELGAAKDPLLVSVRSGAKFSMPGMMETVLNIGLNDDSVVGLGEVSGDERFAWDSYRRLIQMFGKTVLDIDGDHFSRVLDAKKAERGVGLDYELSVDALRELVEEYKRIVVERAGIDFPQDPRVQLDMATEAVFRSWNTERAHIYRRREKIPHDLGTAVNVCTMVFGNMGKTSGTGVCFTRDPSTGRSGVYGDYLVNAQGEDVVAGIRNTLSLADLERLDKASYDELRSIMRRLETHYRDLCDIEFTIERGKLWLLQTRVGKRTALSALKVAMQMVEEGRITKEQAILRVAPDQLDQLLHPQFDSKAKFDVAAKGMNASPGAAVGAVVFSSDAAVHYANIEKPCILVRWETTPDDLKGMVAAEGILTSHGGKTSHAAVIARGMGAPCVCGAEALRIDAAKKEVAISGTNIVLHEGDIISIDGTTGNIIVGEVPLKRPELTGDLETMLEWADDVRHDASRGRIFGVRTNADNPEDAQLSVDFGAEGIGLDRTEHMFLGERKQIIQTFILADTNGQKQQALGQLLKVQTGDFMGMFKAMDGKAVIVRLLDPPLHEFLDDPRELAVEIAHAEGRGENDTQLEAMRERLARLDSFQEANPMLGLRGCRLGIVYPELNDMQVRAIAGAAATLKKQGLNPRPEIMVPLISTVEELKLVREQIQSVIKAVEEAEGLELSIPIGCMIELPRAAVTADEIGAYADFFSFGTNDLTQTTFGFSRDDVESAFIPQYLNKKILKANPFETLDVGVAKLVEMGVKGGHAANETIVCGICGETGGDPDSIQMYYDLGLDYVSCSPYRVPIARLAGAQAKINSNGGPKKLG